MEGLHRLRHRRDPPGGFAPALLALLEPARPDYIRVAAASAIASAPDPSDTSLRALVDLAARDPDEDLAREAARAAGEHAAGRPWVVTALFALLGRRTGAATMFLDSRLGDWVRDGVLSPAELAAALDDPDPPRRRLVLRLMRRAAPGNDPALLASALRAFLTDPDDECRDTAIWVYRDAWREDRDRERAPLDATHMAAAAGDLAAFWRHVGALLQSGAARACATGEHLQWIAAQAAPETLAPFAGDPAGAAALLDALCAAAADRDVRVYPRNQFVQLAGRLAAASPSLRSLVRERLAALDVQGESYDLRYWVERVQKELDGEA